MKKVLYPGSFDPITKGHMNIIEQATKLFDEVVIAIMKNPYKKDSLFSMEERLYIINKIYKDNKKVKIITGTGATVDIAKDNECKAIIRGLRGVTDFDEEIQLASINKKISENQINTICLFADEPYKYISSSMVKEVHYLGKDISDYVEPLVKNYIERKNIEKQ